MEMETFRVADFIFIFHLADDRNSIKKMECTGLRPAEGIITTITIRFIEMLSACLTTTQRAHHN